MKVSGEIRRDSRGPRPGSGRRTAGAGLGSGAIDVGRGRRSPERPAPVLFLLILLGIVAASHSRPAAGENRESAPEPALLTGTVVRVVDGDTLTLRTSDGRHHKVRLAGIDAPESHQPGGSQARRFLERAVDAAPVTLETRGRDIYGRLLADVHVDDRWINRELVSRGWAWMFRRYSEDSRLDDAEHEARGAALGLWATPDPVPPWDWRHPRSPGRTRSSRPGRQGSAQE